MVKIRKILKRIFSRGYPDLYTAVKNYAEKRGISVDDVMAAALTTYLSADEEGKAELEEAIRNLKFRRGGGGASFKDFMQQFKDFADVMIDLMTKIHGAGQQLIRGMLVNELKGTVETIQEIRRIGAESGGGTFTLEDLLAQAFLARILRGFGVNPNQLSKVKSKKTGKGKVEVIEE